MRTPGLPRSERGSLLIVAMLLCAIIGISLVSYYKLAATALKTSTRSYYSLANVNLAEIGVERAMACFYDQSTGTASATAWTGWTLSGNEARRTFSGFTPGPNTTGDVRVYVNYYPNSGGTPIIVAKSTITPPDGPTQSKFVEVTLKNRGLWVNGLVAKDVIRWVGHPEADSWNSDPDNDSSTPAVAYSTGVRSAACTVACANGSIALGSGGNIYGYSKTSSAGTTSGGSVHGLGTTTNDSTRITTDFAATFPAVTVPSPSASTPVASGSVPTSFGVAGHPAASDGRKYYVFGSGAAISATSTVTGHVTFIMQDHIGADAIRFTGTKTLTLNSGATLIIYTNGNISTFGNGLVNAGQAKDLLIYGTNTTSAGQTIGVGGNGNLKAAIYAPNAALELKGGGSSGDVSGAVVARTIDMNGGTNFHYDEALGTIAGGAGVSVSKWKELQTAAERAVYATALNF